MSASTKSTVEKDVHSLEGSLKDQEIQLPVQQEAPYTAFSKNRSSLIIGIVTVAGFLGPVSGNIYIPILPQLQEVFHVSSTTINATVSVFMAVFAVAPLIWASWADVGGRRMLYLISLIMFILANILLAALPVNVGALFFLRILQAFGASCVMSVGAGTVADITPPKGRAKAISYFMLGPQLGPILGPIISSIATDGQWRWIFGFLAILGAVVYVVILLFLPETLRYLVGNGEYWESRGKWLVPPKLIQKKVVPESPKYPKPPKIGVKSLWGLALYKPVLLCSVNGGLLFASFYAMSVTFSHILQSKYHFTDVQTSLSYICPGISLVSGSVLGGRISDYLRAKLEKKSPGKYIPENRFSIQIVGLIISMAGILGYGWCVNNHVHVVSVFVFTFLGGFGMTWVFVTNTTYLTECSTGQPATMVALGNFMRNIAAAISSAIIDKLIEKMGFGWCFTGLGLIDLIGIGLVVILIYYGPRWRAEHNKKK
ncbi:MFS general substrate transporter [Suhomyces tanzawaensis NRRL Y-17324]|uniref:MFS general substrate transporter n=1 Tax=Suhomyces tanzawaensis NRRL Y-17324 TaxID=984487 RepID=A0A1E4SKP9_9ASCO|nr:MFS general substrate transporter [Suhomyces tanzawaensis NRRL Y-17324]ODV80073.1 MFS general substrate transporter [Suhomyces tanzawaensis NRRL Y-17324]